MLLTPSITPPPSRTDSHGKAMPRRSSGVLSDRTNTTPEPQANHPSAKNATEKRPQMKPKRFNIPVMTLDSPTISSAMAARLASSVVSHVLFLKSQIPFPVAQLSRMPGNHADTRAARKREDLIGAIDTLTSHLQTTFVALSTAFARRETTSQKITPFDNIPPTQVHLAIVLGPSVGAAKARVIIVFDGLETKVWGIQGRANAWNIQENDPAPQDEEGDEDEDGEEDESGTTDGGNEDSESENEPSDSEEGSEPPLSRSPSPCHSDEGTPAPVESSQPFQILRDSPPRSLDKGPGPTLHQSEQPSYEEEQQNLRTADRLLSRTLASACAEDDGGMSSELAPTQMHILLRAPRRFQHAAWIPRQNLTRSLESTLEAFLAEAVIDEAEGETSDPKPKKRVNRVGVKTEGVWIGCQREDAIEVVNNNTQDMSEEDEMIWWTWDGKIVGFQDW
ncbi:hypothetical protein K474DRAFT_1770791 [Panus rudis PR-1116 ss-1]|nr:hypothetical protein K474DRAFT_1770791 [Panus rudis PR-1116 ss-1]